jgi:hypothetical protein
MNEVPMWWLVLSAVFFVLNSILIFALIYLIVELVKFLRGVQPKLVSLTEKVEAIGSRVEELATSVRTTSENLGGRAKSIAGSVDLVAHSASKQFERFSPLIIGVLTALRLMKAVQEYRRGKTVAAATTQAATEPKETVEEQKKVDRKLEKRRK